MFFLIISFLNRLTFKEIDKRLVVRFSYSKILSISQLQKFGFLQNCWIDQESIIIFINAMHQIYVYEMYKFCHSD